MHLSERALAIHHRLLEFYGYPAWRNPLPPIDELVSTILSQNTNDTNRDRAFHNLRERFPTWEQVRDADLKQVIEAIRPAGLANPASKVPFARSPKNEGNSIWSSYATCLPKLPGSGCSNLRGLGQKRPPLSCNSLSECQPSRSIPTFTA